MRRKVLNTAQNVGEIRKKLVANTLDLSQVSIILVLPYLKDRKFVYTLMSIDKFFGVSNFALLSYNNLAKLGGHVFLPIFLTTLAVPETFPILGNLSSHRSGM